MPNRLNIRKNQDLLIVDELVRIYKSNTTESKQALEALLEYHKSYINKYVSILKGNKIDLKNPDTRKFLKLFLPYGGYSTDGLLIIKTFLRRIFKNLETEEIRNELICLFIGDVLNRYRRIPGINFANYMTKVFRFRVKDYCNKLGKELNVIPVDSFDKILRGEETIDDTADSERLDLKWVSCPVSPIFNSISTYQRYLIYLYHVRGLTIGQMKEILGKDEESIRGELKNAKEKMQEMAEQEDREK